MAIQAQLYSDNIGFPLCGSLDCGGTGDGGFNQFCFGRQQKNQNLGFENGESRMYCEAIVDKQRHEIDQFIKSQNERLRLLLQEQREKLVAAMAKKVEPRATLLLKQKDAELTRATNRTTELQNLLNKLEMENQAWRRAAQENEAMVVYLNNTLERLQRQNQPGRCFDNGVDDARSCCEETEEEEEEDRGFVVVCKCCSSRSSCVLFLPCRHLCSCKDCAAFLDCCPVCGTAKKASIEALIS
ncbi:Detected protein of unknown function [Hibiscus syriacus]|uniref:RING-type domain-containing protein n=1 Tax=Hibiscus syriacus TaxID=106335 RepID=A0A6A2XMZ0_HIBSY|nr:probable BOI-related E3 ubiquitin-protein ligase 2 [Hibiscus syriacus]XP_039039818.1 probable BOI-related E3 ubiquitin-protein ligase 2 [Hibiscus syriacus]KAE8668325.1 Detected protein of unknown function [Hibiscus syriacus]